MENLMAVPDQVKTVLSRGISAQAGFVFDLGPSTFLEPNVNFRMAGPTTQFGISHRGFVGANNDSFSGIVGFNASTYMFIGYSYDYTTSGLGRFTTGSHEVILSYTFPSKFKNLPPRRGTRTLYINNI